MATGQLSMRAGLRACQLGFAISLAALAACDACARSEPRLRPASELDQESPLEAGAELQTGERRAAPSVQADAAALAPSDKAARASLTSEEVLELLLVPDVASWTPEEAGVRLSPLGLSREEPLPGSMQLSRATPTLRINVHFLPNGAGTFAFADALLELPVTTAEQARRAYRDNAAYLTKKLGQAKWVKDDPEYPSSGYALGGVKVTLGAVATTKDGLPYVALSLASPAAN